VAVPAKIVIDEALIVASRFLAGLAPAERRSVLAAARERRYPAGAVITSQGAPAAELFLVASGRARSFFTTRDGRKLLMIWATPGDLFGGKALLSLPSAYLVSTEAVRSTRVLLWDRASIRSLADRHPRLLENALSYASDYLDWYVTAHVSLTCHTAGQRLGEVLAGLAHTIGRDVPGGVEFDVTNEELASAANITPFTVSRLLSKWQRNRALVRRRGKLVLRAPQRLFASVE
jgi:CRP-like cAMP-binding protein